jgi:hypothetical protein
MKQLSEFIFEKLHISKYKKSNNLRNISNCSFANLDMKLWFESAKEEKKYNNLIKARKNKNDVGSLKNAELRKLLVYWYLSITNGWLKGSIELKEEIIRRNLFDEDELDAYLLSKYKKCSGFEETEKNMEEYLDYYNVKYDKNEKL